MGKNNKRHGKQFDKETQSPLIKIFKDMIQKENTDPEKCKLLKEKQDSRKMKQYSGSRSKSDHAIRPCESSSSERLKRSQFKPTGTMVEQKNVQYESRTQNHFQGDKKDSWWFWSSPDTGKQPSEDTWSCVNCPLKRVASSEYSCIICLILIFLISVSVIFVVFFQAMPVSADFNARKTMQRQTSSEDFRKKLAMLSDTRRLRSDLASLKDNFDDSYRRDWDDSVLSQYGGLSEISNADFHDTNFRDLNTLEDSNGNSIVSSDLSNVLDKSKLGDGRSSENLRNFYKKLLQTDAQIKKLKQGVNSLTMANLEPANIKTNYDRIKRSAKGTNIHDVKSLIRYPPSRMNNEKNVNRSKRFGDNSEEPAGFILEKKQLVVKYKDGLKRKEKCSHTPKETKSHETQLKHPFYKNSQRLDELLDQFLDKNLPELIPEMMGESIGFESLFAEKKKCKHPTTDENSKNKSVNKENYYKNLDNLENELFSNDLNKDSGQVTISDVDVILSVSTIMSPPVSMNNLAPPIRDERPINARKLLQADDETDDNVGVEDLKEVLADDTEIHDEIDRGVDRLKRNDVRHNLAFTTDKDETTYKI